MATSKDWTGVATVPAATKYFAGGDASDWCVHDPPTWVRVLTVDNRGTGLLYVSVPSQSGTFATTDDAVAIPANTGRTFVFAPDDENPSPPTFGTYGADGATHSMSVTFERVP